MPKCEGLWLMSLVRVLNVYPPPTEKGRTGPSICGVCLEIQAARVIIYVSAPIRNFSQKKTERACTFLLRLIVLLLEWQIGTVTTSSRFVSWLN